MLQSARENIEKYAIGKRVIAAVSGGEDSMTLLTLLCEYADAGKLTVAVANVDHCLRPASKADSAFVRAFCDARNLPFYGITVDVPSLCAASGRGAECEAHFARKAFFAQLLQEGKGDLIATAHHARDNAETVLLHLFRGAGLKGLSGMRVLTDDGLFRPFLSTEKEEISAFVRQQNIAFVTDETNADTTYDRNYIRHVILPAVAERFPAAQKALNRTAAFASEADAFIAAHLDEAAFAATQDGVSVKEAYVSAPYIFEALRRLGQDADVYCAAVDSVLKLKDCRPCARIDLGNGIVAAREYGAIMFYRPAPTVQAELPFACTGTGQKTWRTAAGYRLTASPKAAPYFPLQKGALLFDADKLPANCVLRARKEGDRFTPFGGGSKKLKEYLIDKKVPARLRDTLPLVCRGDEVLIVGGMQISDKIKVTPESKRVYALTAEKEDIKPCDA